MAKGHSLSLTATIRATCSLIKFKGTRLTKKDFRSCRVSNQIKTLVLRIKKRRELKIFSKIIKKIHRLRTWHRNGRNEKSKGGKKVRRKKAKEKKYIRKSIKLWKRVLGEGNLLNQKLIKNRSSQLSKVNLRIFQTMKHLLEVLKRNLIRTLHLRRLQTIVFKANKSRRSQNQLSNKNLKKVVTVEVVEKLFLNLHLQRSQTKANKLNKSKRNQNRLSNKSQKKVVTAEAVVFLCLNHLSK